MRLPLVLLLLTIAACSSGGSASSSSSTIDGGAQCSSVMVDGATFTVERFHAGCTDGNTPTMFAAVNCTDGRQIVQLGKAWAFIGDKVHTTSSDAAADPGYAAAYRACTG